jgi:hypothetical protein
MSLAKHLGLFDANNTQKRPMVIVKDFTGSDRADLETSGNQLSQYALLK